MQRKSLSDILANGQRDAMASAWNTTQAAEDFTPVPAGHYDCRVISGELFTARQGTPGYKLTFQAIDGEHAGRRLWHDLWLTPAALPMTKRDLGKLGITAIDQLEAPVPEGIICRVKVALRRDDTGTEFNAVRSFELLRIETPEAEPFAPQDAADATDFDPGKLEAEGGAA